MHELFLDCVEAYDMLPDDLIPPWIEEVIAMPFVNGHFPDDHHYERPAA
jgi:hypothetical protein